MNDALYENFTKLESTLPLKGFRRGVACAYVLVNCIGFAVNLWVLWMVVPVILWKSNKVPKSILFYILTLCLSDLMVMIAMVFLNMELLLGSWRFGSIACTSYLLFDSLNKFALPTIVFLISRACYASICLDAKRRLKAAKMKTAIIQLALSFAIVLIVLSPLIVYSRVYPIVISANATSREITYVQKCSFAPPPRIELAFNIVATVCSYAIPLVGFIYCYASVPYFLWKRQGKRDAGNTGLLLANGDNARLPNLVLRKVISTVAILASVYLICWTPYWVGLYAHRLFFAVSLNNRNRVLLMYGIHILPYVSCIAYPLIFTKMNRAIQAAHKEFVEAQRRRLKNLVPLNSLKSTSKSSTAKSDCRAGPLQKERSLRRRTLDCSNGIIALSSGAGRSALPRVASVTFYEASAPRSDIDTVLQTASNDLSNNNSKLLRSP